MTRPVVNVCGLVSVLLFSQENVVLSGEWFWVIVGFVCNCVPKFQIFLSKIQLSLTHWRLHSTYLWPAAVESLFIKNILIREGTYFRSLLNRNLTPPSNLSPTCLGFPFFPRWFALWIPRLNIFQHSQLALWILLVFNFTAYGRGPVCKHDFDGDRVKDKFDSCPKNAKISSVDFRKHIIFSPDVATRQNEPIWKVEDEVRITSSAH